VINALLLSDVIVELLPAMRELTNEFRIKRGVGERGSSYTPTPVASGQESPAGADMTVRGVAVRTNAAKRYAELFRQCLKKHNSDCNFLHNSRSCSLKKADQVEFECPFDKKNVKNAYALFRIQCSSNVTMFLKFLEDNNRVVPDFDGETPPGTPLN